MNSVLPAVSTPRRNHFGPARRGVRAARCAALALALSSTTAIGSPGSPGPSEATRAAIARLTVSLLQRAAFSGPLTDERLATTLLERYLDALDGEHTLLLQTDLDELASDRISLVGALRRTGDTRVASALFDRYLERLKEQVSYDAELLRTTRFDFSGHDVYDISRTHAARPRDLPAARALWRQELRAEYLDEELANPTSSAGELAATLERRHARHLRDMKALTDADVFDAFLDALAHAYDRRGDYLGHEDVETYSDLMSLSIVGVGASLTKVHGVCTIAEVAPDSPAARAKLKPGDRVMYVGDGARGLVDLTALPLRQAIRFLRGPQGSEVVLRVLPPVGMGSESRTVKVVRARVSLTERRASGWLVELRTESSVPLRLGRIELPSFYTGPGSEPGEPGSASADVKAILAELKNKGVRGVLLDLRQDPGGSLEEAIRVAGLFVGKGPIVQTRDLRGEIAVANHETDDVAFDGPLVLLTDRMSASASELVAGALQDRGRALIVGDTRTFGKGTVQTVAPLAPLLERMGAQYSFDPGALKLTIAKFYGPGGESPDGRGVAVDIVLPSLTDLAEEPTTTPAAPAGSVPAAAFASQDRVRPLLPALRGLSADRVRNDAAFNVIEAEAMAARQQAARGRVSLNEEERRQDLATALARRRLIQEKARAARAIEVETMLPPIGANPGHSGSNASQSAGPPSSPDGQQVQTNAEPPEAEITAREAISILSDYVRLSAKATST